VKARRSLFLLVVLVLVLMLPGVAHAEVTGFGQHSTSNSLARTVTGSGGFLVVGGVSNELTVEFHCYAVAYATATEVHIASADDNGCVLYKGNTVVDEANALSLPAAGVGVVARVRRATVSTALGGLFKVCWNVGATFLNGDTLTDGQATPSTDNCSKSLL
jgi:hypothetical protein